MHLVVGCVEPCRSAQTTVSPIAALICAIVASIVYPVGFVALILGGIALLKRQDNGKAITGIVLGAVVVSPWPLRLVLVFQSMFEDHIRRDDVEAARIMRHLSRSEAGFQAGGYRDASGVACRATEGWDAAPTWPAGTL